MVINDIKIARDTPRILHLSSQQPCANNFTGTMHLRVIELVVHAPKIHNLKVIGVLHIPPLQLLLLPDLHGLSKRHILLCRTAVNPLREL